MTNKILKIKDTVEIKHLSGVQFDSKKLRFNNGNIVGKISRIYRGWIYKIEIAPGNYVFCQKNQLEYFDERNKNKYYEKRNRRNERNVFKSFRR